MIEPLQRPYASRTGVPVIDRVNLHIFVVQYFDRCMECTFCHDQCCQYGCDTDVVNIERILAHADDLEILVGFPRRQWFDEELCVDPEFPGGAARRTAMIDGQCAFHNRNGRGCLLHKYSIDHGLDVYDIKPLVATLFPLTFWYGELRPAWEILDASLICLNQGPTLYRSVRGNLEHFFGPGLIEELDALEAKYCATMEARAQRMIALPLVNP